MYAYKFGKSDAYKLKFGFSVRNIFNHKNLLSREQNSYTLDTSLQDFDKYGLDRTFNVSLRFYWK